MKKIFLTLFTFVSVNIAAGQAIITIQDNATNPTTQFDLDGVTYNKESYEIYTDQIETSPSSFIGRIGIRHNITFAFIKYPVRWNKWTNDGATPEADFDAAVTMVSNILSFSSGGASVSDVAYGVSWNGVTSEAPSKNAIYDKIETIVGSTDDQVLSLVSNTLTLEDGGSVDLSGYLDNTDAQTLSIVSDQLSISGGNSVDLSPYAGGTAAATTYDNTTSGLTATNVKTALDEVVSEKVQINDLNTGNVNITGDYQVDGSSITDVTPLELTVNTTATANHLNKILWNDSGAELELTIPSDIGANGDVIYLLPLTANSAIKPIAGSGTTFTNTYKTDIVAGKPLLYRKVNNLWIANPDDGVAYSPTTQYYNDPNGASGENEANAIGDMSGTSATLSVGSTVPNEGTYYINMVTDGTTSNRANINWSGLTIGETYTFEIATRVNSGSGSFNVWTGVQQPGGGTADPQVGGAGQGFSNTEWTTYQWTLEATATSGIMRIYGTDSVVSDIDFDSIRIYQ